MTKHKSHKKLNANTQKTTKKTRLVHKPENCKKRFVESTLVAATLLAVFWSLVIRKSHIDQTNVNYVAGAYYWWFLGMAAITVAAFCSLISLLVLKIHRHPLPIFIILLTILSATLQLTAGWQPVIKL